MTLAQQFSLLVLFPLSFLGMIIYLWRGLDQSRPYRWPWTLTLTAAALWASSILRLYGGVTFSSALVFTWGVVGDYAFSLTGLGVLATTLALLDTDRRSGQLSLGMSIVLLAGALALDQRLWGTYLPPQQLLSQIIMQFDLWAAVWITSWFLPVLAAWLFTRRTGASAPLSLYRNQVYYWSLMLGLLALGGALTSVQAPAQPGWQEAGLVLTVLAMTVGTTSLVRRQLPEVQQALRQTLRYLSGTLVIFGLTWLGLWLIVTRMADLGTAASRNLVLIVAAAGFAALFTILYRGVNALTNRLFLPSAATQAETMAGYLDAFGFTPTPVQLGNRFLMLIATHLSAPDSWLMWAGDGPGGTLVLRPLIGHGSDPPDLAQFAADSPITQALREQTTPLAQYDLESLHEYAGAPVAERDMLARWQRVLYLPLRAGQTLVAILALGPKSQGEPYSLSDLQQLQQFGTQFGAALALISHTHRMGRVQEYAFQLTQTLAQERRHLQALSNLYADFVDNLAPELIRPFRPLNEAVSQLQESLPNGDGRSQLETIRQELNHLQTPLDKVINAAGQIQQRRTFNFAPVQIEDLARTAHRQLRHMADARNVRIEFQATGPIPSIVGDEEQLVEAVHHVLHNAIKYNKIGGVIHIHCGTAGNEAYILIDDTGVGIPEQRIDDVWRTFPNLLSRENGRQRRPHLGLTLTQFIVQAHGGRVEAKSNYGAGSQFTLYLPVTLAGE